jgi:hypothetical protein
VCRVTGIVRGAKRLKGESSSVAEVGKEDAQVDQPAVCGWTYFFAGSGAALNGASACDRVRDIVADVPRQNLGAALHTGMLIPNEPPKVRKGNDFVSQRPIDIADSGFVRFQIKNDDLLETIRYAGVLNQFRRRHSLFPAVAGRASLRRPRKHAD